MRKYDQNIILLNNPVIYICLKMNVIWSRSGTCYRFETWSVSPFNPSEGWNLSVRVEGSIDIYVDTYLCKYTICDSGHFCQISKAKNS